MNSTNPISHCCYCVIITGPCCPLTWIGPCFDAMYWRWCSFLSPWIPSPPLTWLFLFPQISAQRYLADISLVLFYAAAAWTWYSKGQGLHFIERLPCDGGVVVQHRLQNRHGELLQILSFLCSAPCAHQACSVSCQSTYRWSRFTEFCYFWGLISR